ncbi:hypothetical protein GCM10028814_08500 [Angustibacter aerolatus]
MQDGYHRLNVLPAPVKTVDVVDDTDEEPARARVEVVRAEKVGDVVRVLLAWDPAAEGEDARPAMMRALRTPRDVEYELGLRLYDRTAGTLAEPLRTSDGTCLCSTNTQEIVSGGDQGLYWADFPAPASSSVTLLMGRDLPPVEDLPISAQQPPLTLPDDVVEWGDGPPPATPGEGAGDPVVHDVVRTVSSFGGSEEAQDGDKAEVSLPSDVLFAFDSSTLNAKAKQVVRAAAPKLARAAKGKTIVVEGHTDDQGSPGYNQQLSLARARAVVAALSPAVESAGIRLQAVGRGESDHLVPNVTPEGKPIEANRQRNRRVTFVFDRDRSRGGERVGVDAPKPLPKLAVARTTQPTAAVPDPVASVLSQDGSVRLDVTSVRRTGQDVVVGMALASTGDEAPWGTSTKVLGQNPFAQNGTLVNVRMVDEQQRTLALPLSYAKGACVCTEDLGSGTIYRNPLVMWAVFPAPPQSTSEVTLRVPGVGQVRDLPVS